MTPVGWPALRAKYLDTAAQFGGSRRLGSGDQGGGEVARRR
jgi:hypothetical protein